MKTRYLIAVAAVLVAVVGMIIAQPPALPSGGFPPNIPGAFPPSPVGHPLPALPAPMPLPTSTVSKAESKPDDLTIDQLLEAVEKFREQKAELEKKEQTYMKVLHSKAAKQKERIDSLTGMPLPVSPPLFTDSSPILPALDKVAPNRP